jgi:hypothetical protein
VAVIEARRLGEAVQPIGVRRRGTNLHRSTGHLGLRDSTTLQNGRLCLFRCGRRRHVGIGDETRIVVELENLRLTGAPNDHKQVVLPTRLFDTDLGSVAELGTKAEREKGKLGDRSGR